MVTQTPIEKKKKKQTQNQTQNQRRPHNMCQHKNCTLWLLLHLFLCCSRHQQQVAGHELDIQHITGVPSVQSH